MTKAAAERIISSDQHTLRGATASDEIEPTARLRIELGSINAVGNMIARIGRCVNHIPSREDDRRSGDVPGLEGEAGSSGP